MKEGWRCARPAVRPRFTAPIAGESRHKLRILGKVLFTFSLYIRCKVQVWSGRGEKVKREEKEMFGMRRGTTVQERPVDEKRTPIQDVPREGPSPDAGYRQPETVSTYERPAMQSQGMTGEEATIHSSSLPRTLAERVLEYTGIGLVLAELILLLRLSFNLVNVSASTGFVS